jgi:hypothetical protein
MFGLSKQSQITPINHSHSIVIHIIKQIHASMQPSQPYTYMYNRIIDRCLCEIDHRLFCTAHGAHLCHTIQLRNKSFDD